MKKNNSPYGLIAVPDYNVRPDTGWNCCVCGETARVLGDGFTWCQEHWDKFDLGRKSDSKGMFSIARLRDEWKKHDRANK